MGGFEAVMLTTMKRWVFIGVMSTFGGLLGIGALPALGGDGFPLSRSDKALEDFKEIRFQLETAIREVQQIEPAYRAAQAEVQEATRQIKSFLPAALEASGSFNQKPGDLAAAPGMKKAPMKENLSTPQFDVRTLKRKAAKLEPAIETKQFFMILRL